MSRSSSAVSEAAAAMGRKRMEGMTAQELREHQRAAATAQWENMTQAEREAFSRRRGEALSRSLARNKRPAKPKAPRKRRGRRPTS